jgi:hypothetical protein
MLRGAEALLGAIWYQLPNHSQALGRQAIVLSAGQHATHAAITRDFSDNRTRPI